MVKKIISIVFILVLVTIGTFFIDDKGVQATGYGISNPRVSNGTSTWDCIYFGHYPQSSDDNGGYNYEPIKWRVLSVNGNDAFLLADQALDCERYNEEDVDVTWETCTLRNWLNNDFYNTAFNSFEKSAIYTTTVKNGNYYNDPYNDTKDKVYLLSLEECITTKYGFDDDRLHDSETRKCKLTQYALDDNYNDYTDQKYIRCCEWWLRTMGYYSDYAWSIYADGSSYMGTRVDYYGNSGLCVRPVLHLNLSFDTWSKAGVVSSGNEYVNIREEDEFSTSKESVLGIESFDILFNTFRSEYFNYSSTIDESKNIIIPGLRQTNQTFNGTGSSCKNMVPQGVCVTDKYILISAYDKSNHRGHSSVIYVKDKKSGEYLKTLILRDAGHVGALAWNGKNTVFISGDDTKQDDKVVYTIKTSDIDNSADGDAVTIPVTEIKVPLHPTFLTYKGGYLYVGYMGNPKTGSNVVMAKCDASGKQVDLFDFSMPNKTQGVSIVQGADGKNYLIASISLGRKKGSTAELRVYELNLGSYLMKYQTPNRTINVPYMNEDVDINNGLLYTCYESAANNYRNNLDGNGFGASPQVDRILVSYAQKILGVKTKSGKSKEKINDNIEEVTPDPEESS